MIELKLARNLVPKLNKNSLLQSIATSAVLAGILLGGSNHDAQAQSAAENAYFNSQYGYCDAKKIAHVWSKDVWEGKVIIGNKILSGLTHLANADINSTDVSRAAPHNQVYCTWEDTELSYRDAEALGRYWNQSPNQAKSTAAFMASKMGTFKLRQVFYSALRSSIEPDRTSQFAGLTYETPTEDLGKNVFSVLAAKTILRQGKEWHQSANKTSRLKNNLRRSPIS